MRDPSKLDPFSRPRIFEAFASLLRPADPAIPWAVVEVDPGWSWPDVPIPEVDALAWGRMPARGRPALGTVVQAIQRELAIAGVRARPPARLRVVDVRRLPPVRRPGRIRTAIRRATMSGALVELARSELPERRIDVVARRAGSAEPPRLRPSGDGSALARLTGVGQTGAELRVAVAGHTKDPLHGRAALLALEAAGVPLVPRPIDGDETAGLRWSTETVIVGDHPRTLDDTLAREVVELLARLPGSETPATSMHERLTRLGQVFPKHAALLESTSLAATAWASDLPAVLEHGDVWLNNLLIVDGRLAGLIDWDTWHPAGVAGADVLSLIAQDERSRSRRELGDLLVGRFWEAPRVQAAVATYCRARGIPDPGSPARAAMAICWWSTAITTAVDRAIRPAADPAWVERNVDGPVATLAELVATFR